MSSTAVPFGPGTVKFGTAGTAHNFECEVTGGKVTHNYEEIDQATRLCDTAARGAKKVRAADGLSLDLVNDLTASGMYAYLHAHDLETVPVEFIPNTVNGAKWDGSVVLTLPSEIGADGWGADLTSTLDLTAVGILTFTPGTATAPAANPAPPVDPAQFEDIPA